MGGAHLRNERSHHANSLQALAAFISPIAPKRARLVQHLSGVAIPATPPTSIETTMALVVNSQRTN